MLVEPNGGGLSNFTVIDIIDCSKSIDKNREKVQGLPYDTAFVLFAGDDKPPDDREGDELALWQKIEDSSISCMDEINQGRNIMTNYQFKDYETLLTRWEIQKNYARILDIGIRMDKFDVRFARDLIKRIQSGHMVSMSQFKYIQYFIYRYREQLRDKIIYEEEGSDELREFLGPDSRETFKTIIEQCEEAHKEVNPR